MMKKWILLLIGIVLVSLVSGCITEESVYDARIGVVVTIPPQEEFVKAVGGDYVDITVMVPPGASPHTYEPTPGQLKNLGEADIYFKVGSGVEFENAQMNKIVAMNPEMLVVDGSKGITTIGDDPHIWNSPVNARKMVENFCTGLIQVDHSNADNYTANKDGYLRELDDLDGYIHERLDGFTNRVFMIYHPAFGYFADEYNLTQIAIAHKGKEPTLQVMQSCIDNADKYNLSYVYVAPQFATQNAETIAHEIGGETVFIDPLAKNYIANMQSVAASLSLEME
ncbi:MAG: high-affinity zinc transporter periplasmic component [Candidatus Syntrophoarchaeum sp. GoM_oil]|nr:MAG: high-affinity zinc transporter periplasmic component [Candidatus Syntrophoarchaeum sp. GoM_oil]